MSPSFLLRNRLISLLIFIVIVLFLPISAHPQGRTHFDAGVAAQERGDFDAAIESFTLAINAGDLPGQILAEAYVNRGNAYSDKDDNERAIQDYTEAIRLNPGYAKAYGRRALAYFTKGDNDRAMQDFNNALRLNLNERLERDSAPP